jgi:hypothetical protein
MEIADSAGDPEYGSDRRGRADFWKINQHFTSKNIQSVHTAKNKGYRLCNH